MVTGKRESAGQRYEGDRRKVLDSIKPVKPVVPPEREGKSTKLADLPHGQPSYGFVPTEQRYHDEVMSVLYKIFSQLERIAKNTEPNGPPEGSTSGLSGGTS